MVRAHGRFFWVKSEDRLLQCAVRETIKTRAEAKLSPVVVGDYVDLEPLIDLDSQADLDSRKPHAVIVNVHPRRTKFSRPKRGREELEQIVAANIEQMLIMTSVARPQFKAGIIDRFLISASKGGLSPVVVMNKIDLEHDLDIDRLSRIYRSIDVPFLTISATEIIRIEEAISFLRKKISIIVGQSGVGKSSLLNVIEKDLNLKVGEISDATQKGIHTTTSVRMYPLSFGGYVVDTPGLRYLGLWDLEMCDLWRHFPEIEARAGDCRFRNCRHIAEPGCAVKAAVENGDIFAERYESYLKIFKELQTNAF